jgi:hypothetical protein
VIYKIENHKLHFHYVYLEKVRHHEFVSVCYKPSGSLIYYDSICRFLMENAHVPIPFNHHRINWKTAIAANYESILRYNFDDYAHFIKQIEICSHGLLHFIDDVILTADTVTFKDFDGSLKHDHTEKRAHYYKMMCVAHLNYVFERFTDVYEMYNLSKVPNLDSNELQRYSLIERRFNHEKPNLIKFLKKLALNINQETTYADYERIQEVLRKKYNWEAKAYKYMENQNFRDIFNPYSGLYKNPSVNIDLLTGDHEQMKMCTKNNTKFDNTFAEKHPRFNTFGKIIFTKK